MSIIDNNLAICIVANDSPKELSRFTYFLTQSANCKFKYYIFNNGSLMDETKGICERLWIENIGHYDFVDKAIGLGECYNRLLEKVANQYCAFIPINNLFSHNWVYKVLYEMNNIDNTGFVSIKSQNDNLVISSLPADEKFHLSYMTKNGNVGGMLFAKTELYRSLGGFDTNSGLDGYEFEEISHRAKMQGKYNYYIHDAKRIEFPIQNNVLFPEKTEKRIYNYLTKIQNNFKITQNGEYAESAS